MWIQSLSTTIEPLIWESKSLLKVIWVISRDNVALWFSIQLYLCIGDLVFGPMEYIPWRIESHLLKYSPDEISFYPIIVFTHICFDRHKFSLAWLIRPQSMKHFMLWGYYPKSTVPPQMLIEFWIPISKDKPSISDIKPSRLSYTLRYIN